MIIAPRQHRLTPADRQRIAKARAREARLVELAEVAEQLARAKPDTPANRGKPFWTHCPICKTGRINFARSSRNGHLHARCSTEGCFIFMQ